MHGQVPLEAGDKPNVSWKRKCLAPYIRPAIFVFYNKVSGTGGFIFRAWLRKKNEFKVS